MPFKIIMTETLEERERKAGIASVLVGSISLLFIGEKFSGLDISMIGALLAIILGYMGRKHGKAIAGTSFGIFILFKDIVYNPYIQEYTSKSLSLAGTEIATVSLILLLLLMIFAIVYVFFKKK